MNCKETAVKVLTEFSRLLIGIVFVFSGFVKAVDPVGGAIKISDYLTAFGWEALQPFAALVSFALSAAEFAMGVCMLLGVYRRYNSFLVLLFMAFMTPLTLYLAVFNPVPDCGCFGDAVVISNWETFFKNVVLLLAAIVVFKCSGRMFQCFTYKVYWFVALFAYFFCVCFAAWNYNHLPVIDFRPFKIGANIPELMSVPEDAPQNEYKYTAVYEKDGVRKEFPIEDCPAGDSTWTFIETKEEPIKKGYEPIIHPFIIYDEEGNDVTDEIWHDERPLFLLIAPRLETADDGKIDEINSVYDYAFEHEWGFYCVTGSSQEVIEEWRDNTGAEYPFRMTDDVELKTIIRSNPGLVLLKDGVVMAKWHYNDIPNEEHIASAVEERLNRNGANGKEEDWPVTILLSFAVPLLLVWVYDFVRFRKGKRGTEAAE